MKRLMTRKRHQSEEVVAKLREADEAIAHVDCLDNTAACSEERCARTLIAVAWPRDCVRCRASIRVEAGGIMRKQPR